MLLMLIKLSSPLKRLFHRCASPWLPGVVDSRSDRAGSSRIFLLFLSNLQPFCFTKYTPCFAFKLRGRLVWRSQLVLVANFALSWFLFFYILWYTLHEYISNVCLRIYVNACVYMQASASMYVYTHMCIYGVTWASRGVVCVPEVCCRDHHPLRACEGCSGRQSNNREEKCCSEPCVSRQWGPCFQTSLFS